MIPDAIDVAIGVTARDSNVTVATLINNPLPICITIRLYHNQRMRQNLHFG